MRNAIRLIIYMVQNMHKIEGYSLCLIVILSLSSYMKKLQALVPSRPKFFGLRK